MWTSIINEHLDIIKSLDSGKIMTAAVVLLKALANNHKVFICGNGGSAADAQHFAAELIGRFESERRSIPAIALTTDTSIITSIANDYGYEQIFSRQLDGLANPNDILIGISTSGNSRNIINAVDFAKNNAIYTIGLLGSNGGSLSNIVDTSIIVNSYHTARIQEAHILILHYWAYYIEKYIFEMKL